MYFTKELGCKYEEDLRKAMAQKSEKKDETSLLDKLRNCKLGKVIAKIIDGEPQSRR